MNSPTPKPPLTSLTQPSKGKYNVRFFVITVIALHAVFFGGLLLQGCKPKTTDSFGSTSMSKPTNDLPALTNQNPYWADTNTSYTSYAGTTATNTMPGTSTNAGLTSYTYNTQPLDALTQPQSTTLGATTEYQIKPGDTPAKIARDQKVSLSALLKANPGLEPRKLKVGQKIQIPAAASSSGTGTGPTAETSTAAAAKTHVVKSGENLTRIAREHGVTVKEIRAANNLKTDRISVGQKLKIPTAKSAPATAPAARTAETPWLSPAAGGTSSTAPSNPPATF